MTVAVKSPDYVEMAVDLLLSLRDWNDEPFAVAVDAPMEAYIAAHHPGIFDAVVRLPESVPIGWACKLAVAEISPFDRTVFIDADTIVLRDLDAALDDAERSEFAMMGSYDAPVDTVVHRGITIKSLLQRFQLERFFRCSSRVFVFEREYGREFLAECLDVLMKELPGAGTFSAPTDEVAIGIVAARRGMVLMRQPFPVYWASELAALQPDNRHKALCHLHDPPRLGTLKWLMAEVAERRRDAGLSSTSFDHWLRKITHRNMPAKAAALVRNWAVRRHVGRRDAPLIDQQSARVACPVGAPASPNLLMHGTHRRRHISTVHMGLRMDDRRDPQTAAPVALAIHCWPEPPAGLRVELGESDEGSGSVLQVSLSGPLPDHPDSVACVRFRGRRARDVDMERMLKGRLRVSLASAGSLRSSVLAIGAGDIYLASTTIEDSRRADDCELSFPARQWDADRGELFLEFRLAVGQLPASAAGVRLELSGFYLGQQESGREIGDKG